MNVSVNFFSVDAQLRKKFEECMAELEKYTEDINSAYEQREINEVVFINELLKHGMNMNVLDEDRATLLRNRPARCEQLLAMRNVAAYVNNEG